jgi:phage terminase small subunit
MKGEKPRIPKKGVPFKVVGGEGITASTPTAQANADIRIPDAPDFMSEEARRVWDELTPHVVGKGHWEAQYVYQFAGYCESVSNFIAATGDIALMGSYFETKTRNGIQEKNARLGASNKKPFRKCNACRRCLVYRPLPGRLDGRHVNAMTRSQS